MILFRVPFHLLRPLMWTRFAVENCSSLLVTDDCQWNTGGVLWTDVCYLLRFCRSSAEGKGLVWGWVRWCFKHGKHICFEISFISNMKFLSVCLYRFSIISFHIVYHNPGKYWYLVVTGASLIAQLVSLPCNPNLLNFTEFFDYNLFSFQACEFLKTSLSVFPYLPPSPLFQSAQISGLEVFLPHFLIVGRLRSPS